jgi:hypothetical protein
VEIHFEYVPQGAKAMTYSDMRAKITNAPVNSQWSLSPKLLSIYWPLNISYLVLYVAEDGSYTIIGVPDRKYLWIMTRLKPTKTVATVAAAVAAAVATAAAEEPAVAPPAATEAASTTTAAAETAATATATATEPAAADTAAATSTAADATSADAATTADGKDAAAATAATTTPAAAAPAASAAPAGPAIPAVEVLDPETEARIMEEALKKASDLGYDTKKVNRVTWTI